MELNLIKSKIEIRGKNTEYTIKAIQIDSINGSENGSINGSVN